jgi:hypothetical protein
MMIVLCKKKKKRKREGESVRIYEIIRVGRTLRTFRVLDV